MISFAPYSSRLPLSPGVFDPRSHAISPSADAHRLKFLPPRAAAAAPAAPAAERASSSTGSSSFCPPLPAFSSADSLYGILGIPIGAAAAEIKSAYRRLARSSHPDVAGDDMKDFSAGEFMKIHSAYSTLSDPVKRADYDRKLFSRLRPFGSLSGLSVSSAATSGFSRSTPRRWETDQCW